MEEHRKVAVIGGNKRTILSDLGFFKASVLRSVDQTLVMHIREKLELDDVIIAGTKRWKHFPENPASMKSENEDHVFSRMKDIYNAIILVAAEEIRGRQSSPLPESAIEFINTPATSGWSPYRNGHFKADGSFMKKKRLDPREPGDVTRGKWPHAVIDHVDLQEYKKQWTTDYFNEVSFVQKFS